jgi:hypothetical protein
MNAKENEASHTNESASRPRNAPGMRPPATESLRRDLIFRLIARGPARLAGHLYRRVCTDRACLTPIAPHLRSRGPSSPSGRGWKGW